MTNAERADGIRRLANRIGCGANPHVISDILLWKVLGHPALNPILLEKWLMKRHYYDPDAGESIRDCMARCFGREWAELAERLL